MLSVLFRLSVALGQKRSSSSLEISSIPHSHRQRREAENTPLTQVFAFQYQCQNPRQLIKRRPTRLTKGMAISERDIWRAANLLIEQHGSDAASTAIQRAGRMLDQGDSVGWRVWRGLGCRSAPGGATAQVELHR